MSRETVLVGWGMRQTGVSWWCSLGACLLGWSFAPLGLADPGPPEPDRSPPALLELVNGDRLLGRLSSTSPGDGLGWQSDLFTAPFQFPVTLVKSVVWPDRPPAPARGDYRCELAGGDVLFGTLLDLREGTLLFDVAGLGPLHIDLSQLRRLSPWDRPGNRLFLGPGRLEDWHHAGTEWSADGEYLVCRGANARLSRDVSLPPQGRLEWILSWRRRLNCDVAIGVAADDTAAFRFEVWSDEPTTVDAPVSPVTPVVGDKLVLVRTVETGADAAVVLPLQDCRDSPTQAGSLAGRLHLQAYYDQDAGRMLVQSARGDLLAELRLPSRPPLNGRSLLFQNHAEEVCLERIEVTRWDGEPPVGVVAGECRVLRDDGTTVSGRLIAFDPQRRHFELETRGGRTTLSEPEVVNIGWGEDAPASPGTLRAQFGAGQALSGELVSIGNGAVQLQCAGIHGTLDLPVRLLQSLTPRGAGRGMLPSDRPGESQLQAGATGGLRPETWDQPVGRLWGAECSLQGRWIDNEVADQPGLFWKPLGSTTASRLRSEAVVVIDYAERARARATRAAAMIPPRGGARGGEDSIGPLPRQPSILHLRTGDKVACREVAITAEGVMFESPHSERTFLAHSQVSALDLRPGTGPGSPPPPKYTSSLTLPRSQRANPPTHLLHAVDGDCLRGRLLELTASEARVEVRQRAQGLPREMITRIQWLHPDGGDVPRGADHDQRGPSTIRAVLDNQLQVSLDVDQVVGDQLLGRSESLGKYQVDLARTVRLELNPAGGVLGEAPEFAGWKLRQAASPRAAEEADGTDPDGATSLVGREAPEFRLDLVGGGQFALADLRGEIVVIDFWASWCGPCLRVIPQVEGVVREFSDSAVRVIGVNLEESAEIAGRTLDQLHVTLPVALDSDGSVARKYGVREIPRTVIVDRQGKVVRVLVGGPAGFPEDLRTALQGVLKRDPPPAQ